MRDEVGGVMSVSGPPAVGGRFNFSSSTEQLCRSGKDFPSVTAKRKAGQVVKHQELTHVARNQSK